MSDRHTRCLCDIAPEQLPTAGVGHHAVTHSRWIGSSAATRSQRKLPPAFLGKPAGPTEGPWGWRKTGHPFHPSKRNVWWTQKPPPQNTGLQICPSFAFKLTALLKGRPGGPSAVSPFPVPLPHPGSGVCLSPAKQMPGSTHTKKKKHRWGIALHKNNSYKGGELLSCCWRIVTVITGVRRDAVKGHQRKHIEEGHILLLTWHAVYTYMHTCMLIF